jgi:hypothetical protein
MDDGTDGWKGRPPPDRLRILYIKIKINKFHEVGGMAILHKWI